MTPEQLDELERLEKAATRGPWQWVHRERNQGASLESPSGRVLDDGSAYGEYNQEIDPCGSDAALIAAMRNALPELIRMARFGSRVAEQEKKLDELEAITKAECEKARAARDRYLAALKAEVIESVARSADPAPLPWNVVIGGITFRVSRKPDSSLEAEEVK